MADTHFSWQNFLIRFIFALFLVFLTYNPSGYSFYHWADNALFSGSMSITPPLAMSAVVLLIGWTIYIRATIRSLGPFGLVLAGAFFGIILWWFIDLGWLSIDNLSVFSYISLIILASILATGMSWSHIRRRISGQSDVDDLDE